MVVSNSCCYYACVVYLCIVCNAIDQPASITLWRRRRRRRFARSVKISRRSNRITTFKHFFVDDNPQSLPMVETRYTTALTARIECRMIILQRVESEVEVIWNEHHHSPIISMKMDCPAPYMMLCAHVLYDETKDHH